MKYIEALWFGGPEVLTLKEKETPKPEDGMLLVEVQAAAVNYADISARLGSFPATAKTPFLPGFKSPAAQDNRQNRFDSMSSGALIEIGDVDGIKSKTRRQE